MKTKRLWCLFAQAILLILSVFLVSAASAQLPPGWRGSPELLDSWSFQDTNGWTDDFGDAPISFTNLASSQLGNGASLVVDSGSPAWLNYEIYQTNVDETNLIVNGPGSITFWYAPADWSSGTNGGNGPFGHWAQLVSVGEWSPDSSYGYWGLSIDPSGSNLLFSAQDGLGNTYTLFTPMSWTTNYFHFLALTWSSTNVSIYVDGQLATNDPGGINIWPEPDVLANGVFFGSDTNGDEQARGLFNDIRTYDGPLSSNQVLEVFSSQNDYVIDPLNVAMFLSSALSEPSTNTTAPNAITGSGYLQWDGIAANCAYNSTNADIVWITNLVATVAGSNSMNVTFSINGGQSGYFYDVFATSALQMPLTNAVWAWMGQGLACNTYTITNVASSEAILILGTPYDPETNNLTAAYSSLVLHLDPYIYDQDGSGFSDGAQVLLGLNPLVDQVAQPGTSSIYSYTSADWISGVSGIRNGSMTMDNEGNVLTVSQ